MQAIKALFPQIRVGYQEFTSALTPPPVPGTGTELGLRGCGMQPAISAYRVWVRLHGSRSCAD